MGMMGMTGGAQFGAAGAIGGGFGGGGGVRGRPGGGGGGFRKYSPGPGLVPPGDVGELGKPGSKTESPATPPIQSLNVLDIARTLRQAGFDGTKFVPPPSEGDKKAQDEARRKLDIYLRASQALARGDTSALQTGELGVDLSLEVDKLRQQRLLSQASERKAAGREFQLIGGLWLDKDFKEKAEAIVVKAQSDAYFRIIERRPEARDVFRLGNALVWVTPSGTALVIDSKDGNSKLDDKEIDKLFIPKK
jgi:hypothetical protein